MADCVKKLKERYPKLSTSEARNLVEAFKEININTEGVREYSNQLKKEMYTKAEKQAYANQMSKLSELVNLKKNLEHLSQEAFRGKADKGAESLVVYSPYAANNQTRNATDIASTFNKRYSDMLDQVLEKNGAINQINSPEFARNIFRDFYDRVNNKHKPNKYGSTITETVDGIIKINKLMIGQMRNKGSTIEFNEAHLITQSYDPTKILRNLDAWKKDMVDAIDMGKSFGYVNKDGFVDGVLDKMSKRLGRVDLEKGSGHFSATGGARKIIFKDGDAAFNIMNKYGYSDLGYGLTSGVKKMSKKYGLVSVFGNRPHDGIDELKRYVKKVMSNDQDFTIFDSGVAMLEGKGRGYNDPNGVIARAIVPVITGGKTLATLRFLGSSAPKILMDMPLTVLAAKAGGTSLPTAMSRTLVNTLEAMTMGDKGRKKLASDMFQMMENYKSVIMEELGEDPSMWHKISEKFYTLNGMSWAGDSMHISGMKTQVQNFTDIIRKGPKTDLQTNELRRAGFTPGELTKLRATLKEGELLSPMGVINSKIGSEVEKEALAEKLATHYHQKTEESITTNDSRTRAYQRKDKPIDDAGRQAISLFSTFMTSMTKEMVNINKAARALSPDGTMRTHAKSAKGIAALSSIAVSFVLMDYVTDTMKQYASGKWDDAEVTKEKLGRHMIDSGAWGILISGIVNMVNGKMPIGAPAPFSITKDIVQNIINEYRIASGDKKSRSKMFEGDSVMERQLDFLFNISPVEKFWATGLIMKAYDTIIEDTGKRHSARRARKSQKSRRR